MNSLNSSSIFLKIIVLSLLVFSGCTKNIFYIPGTIQEEVDKICEREFDGMIIYINQAGKSSFYYGGWKDREKQIPTDPQSLFKIASISKLYIAAAASKLVAANELSLDKTLVEFIPETAGRIEYADQITLAMLIKHRSGIPEYIFHPDFADSDPEEDYMTTASLIFDTSADFPPDKRYKYSNTNYLLLGEILDRTLGYSHHTYINEKILNPVGLINTFNLYSEVDSNEVMSGYYKGYDADLKSAEHTRPGGSMIATAEDVGIFLRALIDGTIFNEEEQAIYESVYEYEHTGWLPGYTSIARYHSDIDAVVVQFVNTSKGQLFWIKLERIYNRIVNILEKQN